MTRALKAHRWDELCRRFSKLVDVREVLGEEPVRGLEVGILLCAYLCGAERTLSGTERTAPDPSFPVYTDKFSRRSLQPAAPTAVRSLSPRFLFPDDRRQNPPPPRCVSGTERDVTIRVANRSLQTQLEEAHAPQRLPIIACNLLRHAGASATQVDGGEFGEDGKTSDTKMSVLRQETAFQLKQHQFIHV